MKKSIEKLKDKYLTEVCEINRLNLPLIPVSVLEKIYWHRRELYSGFINELNEVLSKIETKES